MPDSNFTDDNAARSARRLRALAIVGLGLLTAAAFFNSYRGAFVYDDLLTIVENPNAHQLWPLHRALTPPADSGLPTAGRPLVNLSLAVNYAAGGTAVLGYHVVNGLIHLAAVLTLFGCVRRLAGLDAVRRRLGAVAVTVAFVAAALWAVHPLQTESVTYVVQRAEALMALFYLLTVYCFLRATAAVSSAAVRAWQALAVVACLAGMASKEVMVSAPLMVLLIDAMFVAGSLREAWRARRALYLGLAATWILLGWLVLRTGTRGGTAGFETPISALAYATTQFGAICRYLGLSLWPQPLVFDYGVGTVTAVREFLLPALVVAALVVATIIGLRRRWCAAVAGAWFFAILAPSSSLVPVATETIAEHRMYLPLAALAVLGAVALQRVLGRRGAVAVGLALAVPLAGLTARRNLDYRSEHAIWSDTVAKRPDNPRARFNLGVVLAARGDLTGAQREYEAALTAKPKFASAHSNLASVLFERGELERAKVHAAEALQLNPSLAEAHATLGNLLFRERRIDAALNEYRKAAQLKPDRAEIRANLATALAEQGRLADAVAEYEAALRIDPRAARVHFSLGNVFVRMGRFPEAMAAYETALRLQPDYSAARDNLARVRALAAKQRSQP